MSLVRASHNTQPRVPGAGFPRPLAKTWHSIAIMSDGQTTTTDGKRSYRWSAAGGRLAPQEAIWTSPHSMEMGPECRCGNARLAAVLKACREAAMLSSASDLRMLRMPSPESQRVRQTLQKETVDPNLTFSDERRMWNEFAKQLPIAADVAMVDEMLGGVDCLWLRPERAEPKATIIYAHGGGLTAGSILTHRAFCSELALATGCSVLLVDYALLPEAPLSAPGNDFLAAYSNLGKSGFYDCTPVFFGSDSSGAALAIAALIRIRDQNMDQPTGCFAISGAFDATLSGESFTTRDHADPILSHAALRHWQSQLGDGFDFADERISPLFADLSDLPPTLLLVGEDEVWLDDTKRMHAAMQKAGTACEMLIYKSMWHVWPMTGGMPETDDALRRISEFIQNAGKVISTEARPISV